MMRAVLQRICVVVAVMGGWHVVSAQSPQSIEITKLSFLPAEITIHVGDTVEWINKDPIAHTATAKPDEPGGAWEVMIPVGKSAQYQPTQAGTIAYYCRFHPNMKGQIIVLPK